MSTNIGKEQNVTQHTTSEINFCLSAIGNILSLSPVGNDESFCHDAGSWSIVLDGVVF